MVLKSNEHMSYICNPGCKLFRMSRALDHGISLWLGIESFWMSGYHFNEVGKSAKYKHLFKNHELPNRYLDDYFILMKACMHRPQYSA